MLTEIQRQLWEIYEHTEGRASRSEKLQALEQFLDVLTTSPEADWFPWARSIAEDVVDRGKPQVIRQPLFERAVFPALFAGYQARTPGCARWLAGLAQALYRSRKCWEQLDGACDVALLRAAIEHDPTDRRSLRSLIEKSAVRLHFSLHELPAGVLYGMDGATPEQCVELSLMLDDFCRLVDQEELQSRYAELIEACRLHFRAYREYVLNHGLWASYADYLAQRSADIAK